MAFRYATVNGNWSNPATWDGGVSLPAPGDMVFSNNRTVTIDQNVDLGDPGTEVTSGSFIVGQRYIITELGTTDFRTIGAYINAVGREFSATGVGVGTGKARPVSCLTNVAQTGITAGGSFTISSSVTVKASVQAGAVTCVSITGIVSPTIIGNLTPGIPANAHGVSSASTATVFVVGDLFGVGSNNFALPIYIAAATGSLHVTGHVYGGHQSTGYGLYYPGSGTITIIGNVYGGSHATAYGLIFVSSTGTVNITGDIFSGTLTNAIELNTANITLNITGNVFVSASNIITINSSIASYLSAQHINVLGNVYGGGANNIPGIKFYGNRLTVTGGVYATAFANAIECPLITSEFISKGNVYDHYSGFAAVYSRKVFHRDILSKSLQVATTGLAGSEYTFQSNDVWTATQAAPADVRFGLTYGGGLLTGTCYVPDPASVTLGVPVDSTVGTASSDPTSIAGAVRSELATELARIDVNISSVGGGATAEDIANAVRAELATELARIDIPVSEATTDISGIPADVRAELATELARIDTTISSRLATTDYVTPETKEAIAIAVEAALLNEGDGQQLIDAILQVINTNLDLPALELTAIGNAVRSELATELARIDANISTVGDPLTIASAVRTELATELALVDAAISSRLATAAYTTPTTAEMIADAVRSELAIELARIDIPVSDATTDISGIPADVRSELTPELERIANCATVDSTGAQLVALL